MPLHFSALDKSEPGTLYLMRRIDQAGGALSVSYEDIADLEEEQFFSYANELGILGVDFSGTWTGGGVIYITRKGRSYLRKTEASVAWKRRSNVVFDRLLKIFVQH